MRSPGDRDQVDWSSYAEVYDLMARSNPAYQEILTDAESCFQRWRLGEGDRAADFGAGTGNFSVLLARHSPKATVLHVDSDPVMLAVAERKAKESNLANLHCLKADASQIDFGRETLSGAVCIHALYTFPDPMEFLNRLQRQMKPGTPALCAILEG